MHTDISGVTQIQGMGSLNLKTLSWVLGSFGTCKSQITQSINLIGRWNIKNNEFFLHIRL
jgi:hypothetical protein